MSQKLHGATVLSYGNKNYRRLLLFDVIHVGVKGWMEFELYKLQMKLTDTHRFTIVDFCFLHGYFKHRNLLFCDRFSNIQDFIYE